VGISINAVGRAQAGNAEGRDGLIVEDITFANSADDVDAPAAGGGFEALVADEGTPLVQQIFETLTYEEFITARPDYMDRAREQMKRARQDDAVRAVTTERDQLQALLVEANAEIVRLKKLVKRHRTAAEKARDETARALTAVTLEQAFRAAKLPAQWETDLREQLKDIPAAQWTGVIEREKRKAAAAGAQPSIPVEGAPRLEDPAPVARAEPPHHPLPHDESFDEWNARMDHWSGKGAS
jgi:hypothetical protein